MADKIHPYLTEPDLIVLGNLFEDVNQKVQTDSRSSDAKLLPETIEATADDRPVVHDHDKAAIARLQSFNDPNSPDFRPTVFVTWDDKDIPPVLNAYVIQPYARYASRIVRHPTDVVFITHILQYFFVNLPSAIWLYYNFTYIHGFIHVVYTVWCTGSFTLMMHNHIHNNGILAKKWYWFDVTFPYLTEPLMGHTWDSYYYHHVKHHHVEGNGPDDLSSTVRYQRDDVFHFLHYLGRFLLFVWLELPIYFYRKGKLQLALRTLVSELTSYAFLYYMTVHVNTRASIFVLILPFVFLRLGLMLGNWGQHALVDEIDPDSDFRSSITLVDVPSNRFCFNDGYHTAHHLNPLRHWREQPVHFLQAKEAYRDGRALVFHNIDYLFMTIKLLQKDYMSLASCLVPMGEQIDMTQQEIADMLRRKTRRFTEEEIAQKFQKAPTAARQSTPLKQRNWSKLFSMAKDAFGLGQPQSIQTALSHEKEQ